MQIAPFLNPVVRSVILIKRACKCACVCVCNIEGTSPLLFRFFSFYARADDNVVARRRVATRRHAAGRAEQAGPAVCVAPYECVLGRVHQLENVGSSKLSSIGMAPLRRFFHHPDGFFGPMVQWKGDMEEAVKMG